MVPEVRAGTAQEAAPAIAPERIAWGQVTMAALLMLATLPGRTQGLGLITEPLLRDVHLDRVGYANINLWATLIGSAFCLPVGWLLDRFGLRWTTVSLVLSLAVVVWAMSIQAAGGMMFFLLVLLTRAIGQSGLSVASITTVGKSTRTRTGMAMGGYSILLSIFFMIGFVVVGGAVSGQPWSIGWRSAWQGIALFLLFGIAPLSLLVLRKPGHGVAKTTPAAPAEGRSLPDVLRTPLFWIFAGAIALFGLVASGFGLFNEAVLAERGFDAATFHTFLAVTTMFALVGQFASGWAGHRIPMTRLLGLAMFLYAAGLGTLPLLSTRSQLWIFAAVFGIAAGMITVVFFAIWSHLYGRAHLGRIQGAAQMLSVSASALGPLLFAKCHAHFSSYTPILHALAPLVLIFGVAAWRAKLVPFVEAPVRTA